MSTAALPEGDWIRGISVRQPYAACILAGAKTVENRPARWRTGWVLLHTSKNVDQPALRIPLIGRTIRGRELVTGAVVGVARITGCHQDLEVRRPALSGRTRVTGSWCSTTCRSCRCPARRAGRS
ncbi:ASCH domain-containing protein [Streptomyces bobili]|uniref:hypothetical protein n=1 Tax=Streptomyces bobili TaxID=67280 RepID=UPI003713C4C9